MATVITSFMGGLFRAPLTTGDSSNNGRLEGQALSRYWYSKHFVGAIRAWTAQVRRRVAFLTRKLTLLPRYAFTVSINAADSVCSLAVRALEHRAVRRYPVGWATRAQPVDAQTRAAILAAINKNVWDKTLLIIACRDGYVKVVEDLLQLIPQHIPASFLEASSLVGWAALHYAVMGGYEEVVDLLLRAGAQANGQDIVGATTLILGASTGCVALVRRLLQHLTVSDLELSCAAGHTALSYAAQKGTEEVIDLLLSHGAHASPRDHRGVTPLMHASLRGHLGVVERLLQVVGEDGLKDRSNYTMTALHYAAFEGHENMVAFLLSNGAQANSKDMGGSTPLMMASLCGHQGVVQILLQHMRAQGLDDKTDEYGNSALHLACIEDIAEGIVKPDDGTAEGTVRALLLAGADVSAAGAEGATPRTLAKAGGHSQIVAVLDWWEAELERPYLLYRAKRLREIDSMHQDAGVSSLPAYLKARGVTGLAVPQVEVVAPQQRWNSVGSKALEEDEEERRAVLAHVLENLNDQLFIELINGFHRARGGQRELVDT